MKSNPDSYTWLLFSKLLKVWLIYFHLRKRRLTAMEWSSKRSTTVTGPSKSGKNKSGIESRWKTNFVPVMWRFSASFDSIMFIIYHGKMHRQIGTMKSETTATYFLAVLTLRFLRRCNCSEDWGISPLTTMFLLLICQNVRTTKINMMQIGIEINIWM